ncbi:MAG TPA: TonB-dependent receptor [Rhodanobacteraceae bacterium]
MRRDAPTDQQSRSPVTLTSIEVHGHAPDAALRAQQKLTPGAVNIVNGEALTTRAVSNMADALRYVPGVMANSNTGGDASVLSIRGSNLTALNYDNSGILLLQDGLPVTTADGANHNRLVDPLTARSIVVADGANALSYGASQLGGAIDFISRTARNSDPNQVYLYGGEHGLMETRVSTGGVSGNLDGMVTADAKHFSGYQQHSHENRESVYGNVGWRASDKLRFRFFGTFIDSRQQLTGSLTRDEFNTHPRGADPSYVLGNHQLDVRSGRLAGKGTWDINADSSLEFGLSYEVQSLYHPIVNVFDFSTVPPTQFFSLLISTVQRTGGGMLRYHLKAGNHDMLAGLNLAYTTDIGGNYENDGGHKGARTDDVNQRARNATLFWLDRWHFAPRWTFIYGAQGVVTDRNVEDVGLADHAVRDQRVTYKSINPRLGVIYTLTPNSEAFASASRLYEAPNNFELNNDVTQNDMTLLPMQGMSYEVGTRGTRTPPSGNEGSVHWSLDAYYAKIRNEILSVEDPTQPGNMLAANYPHTVHAGVEALIGATLPMLGGAYQLAPLVSATYDHFTFQNDRTFGNNQLPSAPNYIVHGEIMLHNTGTGVYFGPTFDWVGRKYADMANTYRVGGYGLVGVRAGIQRHNWELFVDAHNLTNRRYANAVTVLTQAAADARVLNVGAPRSIFAGLRIRY